MTPCTFETCDGFVLQFDGVRDDSAPGENFATSYGITAMTWAWAIGQGVVADKPLAAGTVGEFEAIRRALFWNPLRCAQLPAGVALMVYNDGVLCGVGHEASLLARVIGSTAPPTSVIGPDIMRKANSFGDKALIDALAKADETYLASLAKAPLFLSGWTRREEAARALAYQMAGVSGGRS